MTATDYTFAVSDLEAEPNQIEFANAGKQLHHLMAFPHRKGATLDAVKKVITEDGGGSGPLPLDFAGATRTAPSRVATCRSSNSTSSAASTR